MYVGKFEGNQVNREDFIMRRIDLVYHEKELVGMNESEWIQKRGH